MRGASACLLQVAAPTFVFVASVIEMVCVAEERSRTGDSHVSVHVQVHTENHSVLGFFVARGGYVFLHGDVEVVRVITLVERCFGLFPFVRPVSSNGVSSSLTGVTYSAVTRFSVVARETRSSLYVIVRPLYTITLPRNSGLLSYRLR
ncbi:MAG: hypothetical protein J07HQW2_00089 [Haloquadratum walsbyi J07HQW2]|uniref:Uncharacterized protein n=1 Tax=Haloquadratum walsbyi J07HQW2 TaxID=1238425 RepID=U1PN31_9EURY|nr:MAG: hypothetical protein J07HQW2_00089 [Haloquadratum walsbyi J07HQW2]